MTNRVLSRPLVFACAVTCGAALAPAPLQAEAPPGRYTIGANGTVFDTKTQLTWQRSPLSDPAAWADAGDKCDKLKSADLTWRLPTVNELQSLVDESRTNPAIDPLAFPDTPAAAFWTSTGVAGFQSLWAWTVSFADGTTSYSTLSSTVYIRCVH